MRAELPAALECYAETPVYDERTAPPKLTTLHDTKPGVWGRLVVLTGALDFVVPGAPQSPRRVEAGGFAVIEPTVPHRIELEGPVTFRIEFHRRPAA